MAGNINPVTIASAAWSRISDIPARVIGWFRGKTVNIVSAIKNLFSTSARTEISDRSIGQIPTPVASRTVSVIDNTSSGDLPATQQALGPRIVSQSDQAVEPFHSIPKPDHGVRFADKTVPVFPGKELRRISEKHLSPVISKMNDFGLALTAEHKKNLQKGVLITAAIAQLMVDENFNDDLFLRLAKRLGVSESIMVRHRAMTREQKIDLLRDLNNERARIEAQCTRRTSRFYREFSNLTTQYQAYGIGLMARYSHQCPREATREEVVQLQNSVASFQRLLSEFTKGVTGTFIDRDKTLKRQLSDIKNDLNAISGMLQSQK